MITMFAGNDFGDNLGDGVAGPLGLLIIVLLVIATVLLVRNMNARLRRLPDHFPDPDEVPGQRPGGPGGPGETAEAAAGADATSGDPTDTRSPRDVEPPTA